MKGATIMPSIRKAAALLTVLTLVLSITGALAADYTATGLFTITYDDALTLDDTSYQDETTGGESRWLFMLSNSEYIIDVTIERIAEYESLSLFSATNAEKQRYLNDTLDSFSDDNATYLETIEAGPNLIPFYLYQLESEEGPYLMAETIVKGYAIDFCAYYCDESAAADEALAVSLSSVLASFLPVQ